MYWICEHKRFPVFDRFTCLKGAEHILIIFRFIPFFLTISVHSRCMLSIEANNFIQRNLYTKQWGTNELGGDLSFEAVW